MKLCLSEFYFVCLGQAIASEILKQLRTRGVEACKILGLGSDGASVMTGKKEGVAGLLRRANPHIINVHCVAHRFNLWGVICVRVKRLMTSRC